jgi:hypothetical protein
MLSESTLIVTQALQATLQSTSDLPSDLQECLVSLGPILQHHPEQADTAVDSALQHLSTLPELYRIFQDHLDRLEEAQNPGQEPVFRRSMPSYQQSLFVKPLPEIEYSSIDYDGVLEPESGRIKDHSAFLNSYAPEDEGLYDDY